MDIAVARKTRTTSVATLSKRNLGIGHLPLWIVVACLTPRVQGSSEEGLTELRSAALTGPILP